MYFSAFIYRYMDIGIGSVIHRSASLDTRQKIVSALCGLVGWLCCWFGS